MPNDVKVEREKGDSVNGKTDYERLKKMSEKEIEENAASDPDAPPVSDEDLKKFKRVNPKQEKQDEK